MTKSPDMLTPREREVMMLVSQGKTHEEIAICLEITSYTVKFHTNSVRMKLNAVNAAQAVALAVHRGLITV